MTNTIVTKPDVAAFFDKDSNTFSYVVKDPASSSCAIVDSVLDFDYASGGTSHKGADEIIAYVTTHKLKVEWLIETHVHADHISAAPYIQSKVGGKIGIGEQITTVQETFAKVFNEGADFLHDGSQFDFLFEDGEQFQIGEMQCTALHTPGHTPACFTHVLGDAVFVGDTLFMPDAGTARADFPGGDAGILFDSVQRILALPEDHRIFMCHDYCPNGRELEYETTVKAQREFNIHVKQGISKSTFVDLRETRDKTLAMPRLILPSLQINMRAGHMPEAESNGLSYLKIPLNAFK
ncbi:MBL fold metallo-hydrolase [Marinomonas sp. BSi20584]|uniref:MBL fold metallo-hydrolase n=1 Tax=Marinomonas sp. BSi20584 TaxID=1594462 RepID=UPI000C1E2FC6|nr:MBL fold metallo-hydrolase [Marinomonas sp. BSi20584]PJE54237.1 beta-lactamase [Marinomonas sp. BSi20584]